MSVQLLRVACCILLLKHGGAATNEVQWYRTAQSTTDRVSPQPNLPFGGDFPSDVVVTVDRLRAPADRMQQHVHNVSSSTGPPLIKQSSVSEEHSQNLRPTFSPN